jgi:hypothetical protein
MEAYLARVALLKLIPEEIPTTQESSKPSSFELRNERIRTIKNPGSYMEAILVDRLKLD